MKTLRYFILAAIAMSAIACSGEKPQNPDPEEEEVYIFDNDIFEEHTDEESGVVSYFIKSGICGWENSQSNYFNTRSMTNDERFIFFFGSNKSFARDADREGMILDLKTRKFYRVPGCHFSCCPYLDPDEDKLYYATVTDKKKAKFYRRDLLEDPTVDIPLADFPKSLVPNTGNPIKRVASHLTLTRDKQKVFLDARINDEFYQGLLNLYTGEWEEWGHTDIHLTHGQLNPVRDDLALMAYDEYTKLDGTKVPIVNEPDGTYPRIQLVQKGSRKTLTPDPEYNYATHECWDESGKYVYWCSRGCCIRNIETNQYEKPYKKTKTAHCFFSYSRDLITFDDQSPDFYRGCRWKVGFYNVRTDKMVYIHTLLPALVSKEEMEDSSTASRYQSFHSDPHPQFVCKDKYIVCTAQRPDGTIRFSITPVDQLIKLTK